MDKLIDQKNHPVKRQALESLRFKVNAALVEHAYKQNHVGLLASLLCVTILLISLYPNENKTILISWYIACVLITIVRFILIRAYFQQRITENNLKLWRNWFVVGALLGGITWGFVGGVLFPADHSNQVTLTILILAGITAGAVPALSAVLSACIIFLLASLLPLFFGVIFSGNNTLLLYGYALLIYLIYLVLLCIKSNRVTKNSLMLQFENDVLLHTLSEAKVELEDANKKLKFSATHDALTGLLNRHSFEMLLVNLVQNAEQHKKMFVLFHLDLDGFKEVNETYGHHIGDKLLEKIAAVIKRLVPKETVLARIGGDEILIIIEECYDPEKIAQLAQKICDTVEMPFAIESYSVSMSISIGIAVFPIDGHSPDLLLKNASHALSLVKKQGGNNFNFNSDFFTIKTAFSTAFSSSKR